MGDIGTEDSIPALAKTLAQPSEDWSILDSAVESLNRIGTPKAIQEIKYFQQKNREIGNFNF